MQEKMCVVGIGDGEGSGAEVDGDFQTIQHCIKAAVVDGKGGLEGIIGVGGKSCPLVTKPKITSSPLLPSLLSPAPH
jgi:hypothetical protein